MAGSTVIVPKITGYAAYDPTAIAITGGTGNFSAGSAANPSITAGPTNNGFYYSGAGNNIDVAVNGGFAHRFQVSGFWIASDSAQYFAGASADTALARGSAGVWKFANANSFSANGSVATVLGSVGPTGSHTTVQKWLTIQDNGAVVGYIPVF